MFHPTKARDFLGTQRNHPQTSYIVSTATVKCCLQTAQKGWKKHLPKPTTAVNHHRCDGRCSGKEGTGPIATALRCRLGQLHRLGRVDQCPEFQSEKPSENSQIHISPLSAISKSSSHLFDQLVRAHLEPSLVDGNSQIFLVPLPMLPIAL